MAVTFDKVIINIYNELSGSFVSKFQSPVILQILDESDNLLLRVKGLSDGQVNVSNGPGSLSDIQIFKETETSIIGQTGLVLTENGSTTMISFPDGKDNLQKFAQIIKDFKFGKKDSVFAQRTDDASASQYFQFYGYLSQQQNMMQDYIRTSTYQRAILSNLEDFKDKVVLDVGAGSGILSFFAAQAGARKVYAVEASSMAKHAETLVYHNKLQDIISVIPGKIEEIQLPEMVDVIISEPMGYMLFNERMLETYLHAKKWLADGGKMFPSRGDLHIAPFTDAQLYTEQVINDK